MRGVGPHDSTFGERWQVLKYDATEDYRHRLEIINGTKGARLSFDKEPLISCSLVLMGVPMNTNEYKNESLAWVESLNLATLGLGVKAVLIYH